MPTITDLSALVDKFGALLPELDLDGDEQEEYSTMLLRLQNQVENGEPIEWIVKECVEWLTRFTTPASRPLQGNAA